MGFLGTQYTICQAQSGMHYVANRQGEALVHGDWEECATWIRARRRKDNANRARRELDEAYRSCGMVKTRYGWE